MPAAKTYSSPEPRSTDTGDEYLSICETAARIGLSPKRVRNLMSTGVLRAGYHFFRPQGIAPRFKWSPVVEWLEMSPADLDDVIPMASTRNRRVAPLGRSKV